LHVFGLTSDSFPSELISPSTNNPGSGTLKIACWFGSGPSDPRRHVKSIGNASTGRLAKFVRIGAG
jgi:hypothetical protein